MITDTKVTIGTTESMPEEMEAQIGKDLIQGLVGKADEDIIKRYNEINRPILHLNDKRGNRKAICRKFGITMKYLRKQIKLAKREGIDISHWGC